MKQITNCILIILILFIAIKCFEFIILRASSKENQLKYCNKKWNDYLKQREKAIRATNKIENIVYGIKTFIVFIIPDDLLKVILIGTKFLIKLAFKELTLKNLIEKPVNFIYLRRYNPESIKANITRLENQYGKSLLLTL